MNKSTDLLIQSVTGGKNENRKTWVHPQVAINIAQWISPEFDVKVSKWIFELMITEKLELKSNEELESQYKEKIQQLSSELDTIKTNYQTLSVKHISTLKTHRYIKFKKTDPCFYIIESGVPCDCGQPTIQYKFGIAGNDQNTIDDRLKSHRTLWPLLKVRFLLFMKDVVMCNDRFT